MAAPKKAKSVVRYAVVGQGYIAQAAVLPAFRQAKRSSRLVARPQRLKKQPTLRQEITRPPVRRMPRLVGAAPPGG